MKTKVLMSTSELQALRRKLTQLYIDRGYINSGVTLPDQKVRDVIITLRVIEGVLSRIDVAGVERLKPTSDLLISWILS